MDLMTILLYGIPGLMVWASLVDTLAVKPAKQRQMAYERMMDEAKARGDRPQMDYALNEATKALRTRYIAHHFSPFYYVYVLVKNVKALTGNRSRKQ